MCTGQVEGAVVGDAACLVTGRLSWVWSALPNVQWIEWREVNML